MLLYLSSEKNVDIFETQSKQLGIHTDVIVERDFTGYIEKNSSKLSHLEFLAIDLENIVDDEISLINSLSAFRLCNNNIIIIIVGIGRKHGDNFLGKFFAEGIYNFVTSKDELIREREIKNCLENTNNYINSLKDIGKHMGKNIYAITDSEVVIYNRKDKKIEHNCAINLPKSADI